MIPILTSLFLNNTLVSSPSPLGVTLPDVERRILSIRCSNPYWVDSVARFPRKIEERGGKLLHDKVIFVKVQIVALRYLLEGPTWKWHNDIDVSIASLEKRILRHPKAMEIEA